MPYVSAPSDMARNHASKRPAALATPPGALGRLGELGIWVATCQGHVPPAPGDDVRLVIFAGDHGVASHGVSAFPPAIPGAMVRTFLAEKAAVNALAATHDVGVHVIDLGVDDDFADLDEATRAALTAHKVRRSSGAIHLEDALTPEQTEAARTAGAAVAREEIRAGAQLLISGDMGIGDTTPGRRARRRRPGSACQRGRRARHRHGRRQFDAQDRGHRCRTPASRCPGGGSARHADRPRHRRPERAWCRCLVRRRAPLHRSRPVPRAGQEGTRAAAGPRHAPGEGSGSIAAVPSVRSAAAVRHDVALLSDLGA
jgi:hypothetical protein